MAGASLSAWWLNLEDVHLGKHATYLAEDSAELSDTHRMSALLSGLQIFLGTGGVPALVIRHFPFG